ncbi:hypothetical protein [Micromonospora sp. NBC_00858]|uniref:hypothetical protein n=1 Tax=Micromonospora sp. NBC_00858 TaxID=2975979 RepID=UPI0038642B0E|nr:hypothetical protein OG990_30805 [Micromonospora sp. NBC_00858]
MKNPKRRLPPRLIPAQVAARARLNKKTLGGYAGLFALLFTIIGIGSALEDDMPTASANAIIGATAPASPTPASASPKPTPSKTTTSPRPKPTPSKTTTNPRPKPTATRTTSAPHTTAPSIRTGVTPGAFCKPAGARGRTSTGKLMVCKTSATDSRLRWRAA